MSEPDHNAQDEQNGETTAGQELATTPQPETVELIEDESEQVTVIVRQASSGWAAAAVFITIILVGFLAFYLMLTAPAEMVKQAGHVVTQAATTVAESVSSAFKVTVNANTIIGSTIQKVQSQAKLVVLTANVEVDLEKSSEKKVLWDYLDLGTTTTRVRATDNQVQYYIDLAKFGRNDIVFDSQSRSIIVTIPEPQLDETFVDVQTDPTKIQVETSAGWARLTNYSGEHLEKQALQELRTEVVRAGNHALLREKARDAAVEQMRGLLEDIRQSLSSDVVLEIRFKDELPPDALAKEMPV